MGLVVVGGGAAGFFSAIAAAERVPVVLLEKTNQLLTKVRISGGGRCNVTHDCQDPRALILHYPRGSRELLGPFHRFGPKETLAWFEARGVPLVTESDGRMFPSANTSEAISRCLMQEARRTGVEVRKQTRIETVAKEDAGFRLRGPGLDLTADRVILATGSGRQGYQWARSLGHTIRELVPSLFTFTIADFELSDVAGAVAPNTTISLAKSRLTQSGPLLVTHWGFSGPAALKLSAWGAREMRARCYNTELIINWIGDRPCLWGQSSKQIGNLPQCDLPKRLWRRLLMRANVALERPLNKLGERERGRLEDRLRHDRYLMVGKTTHKEEFVTCGGVNLREVDFRTMESRACPGLHVAGEILDIDGVTGGFNFQSAWTTGFIAGHSV